MKIHFWSVGKTHDSQYKAAIEHFTKRISHYYPIEWKLLPPSNSKRIEEIKVQEATSILQSLPADAILVALDENGKQWNSIQFADYIQQKANESCRHLIFLIGGAYGIGSEVLKRANFVWSLSALVFPHQLVRLILSEQVYRACTILRNEKYHHS